MSVRDELAEPWYENEGCVSGLSFFLVRGAGIVGAGGDHLGVGPVVDLVVAQHRQVAWLSQGRHREQAPDEQPFH